MMPCSGKKNNLPEGTPMNIKIINSCKEIGLRAGIAIGKKVAVQPSPAALMEKLEKLVEERASQEFPPSHLREGVRRMLKMGGFKASGRNKPASEYLAQSSREGRFPFINNLVDCNNYLSLLSGLPISLLDMDATGTEVELRTGLPGESYVFNSSGQVIDLKGLVCLCRKDGPPLGNPVKDSMEAKLKDETDAVIGIIYAPSAVVKEEELLRLAHDFAELFSLHAGAGEIEATFV
jgi:DNA/RNA-binding domain of Phe-tRNA-synthetase-like protein